MAAAQRPAFSCSLREYSIDKSIPAFKMPSTSKSKRSAASRLERDVGPPLLVMVRLWYYLEFGNSHSTSKVMHIRVGTLVLHKLRKTIDRIELEVKLDWLYLGCLSLPIHRLRMIEQLGNSRHYREV